MARPKVNPFKSGGVLEDEEVERIETAPPEQQPPAPPEAPPAEPPPEQKPAEPPHEETVNYDRFKALNERALALEKELGEHREFRARLDERQRIIHEANEQARQQAEQQKRAQERPDPNLDPIGAELYDLRNARAQDRAEIEQLRQMAQQQYQQYNTGQEQQQFSTWVQNEANSYAQQDQDYFPAAKHAADWRIQFWREIAPNAPRELAEKLVEGESVMIARLAQQYGGKFAPAISRLAKQLGFQAPNGNGAPRPRAQSPQQQRLNQVQGGQRLQGLSAVPSGGTSSEGASPYRNYSAADIANMSEREFSAAMANPNTARDLRYAMARAEGVEGDDFNV